MNKKSIVNKSKYLTSTQFIDCDSPLVVKFAQDAVDGATTDIEKGIKLYYAVRDFIRYNPYTLTDNPKTYSASWVLQQKESFCVPKAILLAAVARAVNIPSRLGFANVRNHLATERLLSLMQTDVFIFHGYTQLYLADRWVKATPTFNLSLCQKFNVKPLEFNGKTDSIFHSYDTQGNKYMEYLHDHGQFDNLPFNKMMTAFREGYPQFVSGSAFNWPTGNFKKESKTK